MTAALSREVTAAREWTEDAPFGTSEHDQALRRFAEAGARLICHLSRGRPFEPFTRPPSAIAVKYPSLSRVHRPEVA